MHVPSVVEVAIEDVSEESSRNRLSLVSSGKSCGHSCEAQRQDLCCLCTVEQGAVDDSMEDRSIITALSNCSLCQRLAIIIIYHYFYNNYYASELAEMLTSVTMIVSQVQKRVHMQAQKCRTII